MKFETGLEFGRNASIINEAYAKMYEAKPLNKRVSNEPSDEELSRLEKGDFSRHEQFMKNYDGSREYREVRAAEKRKKQNDAVLADIERKKKTEPLDKLVTKTSEEGDDEESLANLDSMSDRFSLIAQKDDNKVHTQGDDDGLIFGYSHHQLKYSEAIIEAAVAKVFKGLPIPADMKDEVLAYIRKRARKLEQINAEIPENMQIIIDNPDSIITVDTTTKTDVEKPSNSNPETTTVATTNTTDTTTPTNSTDNVTTDNGSKGDTVTTTDDEDSTDSNDNGGDDYEDTPENNFFNSVVLANPSDFNDSLYDMEELAKHKKEILDGVMNIIKMVGNPVNAVIRALEGIDGCERKQED